MTSKNEESVFGTTDAASTESANVPVTARPGARYLHAAPGFQETKLEWRGAAPAKSVRLLRDGSELHHNYENGF